jgi:spore germination cell wall hydrolase CwlJ-like protein
LRAINHILTDQSYRRAMRVSPFDLRLSAGLVLLATSASCVPTAGSAGRLAVASVPAEQPKIAAGDPRYEEARRIFWERAAKLFEPVSASPAEPFEAGAMNEIDRARSIDCLTSAIYHEARSEPIDGQRAVAQVVLNRVRHPAFPSSVCGVVFQGSERRTGCQFSFTCDGSLGRRRDPGAWQRAAEIAEEALSGGVYAQVGNATHYHTTAILPYWAPSLRRSAVIGSHIFYRWKGNAGEADAFSQRYAGLEPVRAVWQPVERGMPTIHRGAAQKAVEKVQVEDGNGSVTIHRGSTVPTIAAEESGVRVHVGIPETA